MEDAAAKLVDTADINNGQVTLAKLANIATARVLGRITAGAGVPEALTPAQLTLLVDLFTDVLAGVVPASGGGTSNFLRADGTWAAPAGGGSERHFIRANVDRVLPNDANLNPLFNDPANGRLTLTTGVYRFRGLFIVTAMSATSGNALFNILGAGTATIGSWLWRLAGLDNTAPSTVADDDAAYFQVGVTASSAVAGQTGTAMRIHFDGTFEVTASGTVIPSIDLGNAAPAVVQDGSFIEFERMGDVDLVSLGSWD